MPSILVAKKSQREKSEYYKLQGMLRREYDKLSRHPKYDVSYIQHLERELEVYERSKCDGAILRSKVQWALESDRNTSFFLNLEKSKQESNCIRVFREHLTSSSYFGDSFM